MKKIHYITSYSQPKYVDLDLAQPRQKYGEIEVKFIRLSNLRLPPSIMSKITPTINKQIKDLRGIQQ